MSPGLVFGNSGESVIFNVWNWPPCNVVENNSSQFTSLFGLDYLMWLNDNLSSFILFSRDCFKSSFFPNPNILDRQNKLLKINQLLLDKRRCSLASRWTRLQSRTKASKVANIILLIIITLTEHFIQTFPYLAAQPPTATNILQLSMNY